MLGFPFSKASSATRLMSHISTTHISSRACQRQVGTSVAVMLSHSGFSLMKCLQNKKQDFLQANNQLLLKLSCSLTLIPASPPEKCNSFPHSFNSFEEISLCCLVSNTSSFKSFNKFDYIFKIFSSNYKFWSQLPCCYFLLHH